MGASASKASKAAASNARKFPTRVPPSSSPSPASASRGPTVHPRPQVSTSRDEAIKRDAADPDFPQFSNQSADAAFSARLSQLGPVQPSPTLSNSSTFLSHSSQAQPQSQSQQSQHAPPSSSFVSLRNPALELLRAREALAKEAEEEIENMGRRSAVEKGRKFADVVTIRQALLLRDGKAGMGGAMGEKAGRGGKGLPAEEIERMLGLRRGTVGKLGAKGVVGVPI